MDLSEFSSLPPGSKVPVVCCKASKKTAAVFRGDTYVRFWCARCGKTESIKTQRVLNWIKKLAPDFLRRETKTVMPPDCTTELSKECLVWLGKYGISADVAIRYGVRYSDMLQRCVLPVVDQSGEITCAQYRALHPEQKPKYLTTSTTTNALWFSSFTKDPETLVVTEDILSSIKINHCCPQVQTCAILGTSFTAEKVFKILNTINPKKVIIWLDGDAAGQKGMADGLKKFRMQGAYVRSISTSQDPKELSAFQLSKVLTTEV